MDSKQKHLVTQIEFQKNTIITNKAETSLTKILGSNRCQDIIANSREYRDRVYPPLKTVLMFTKQVLNPDKSCKNIVAETIAKEIMEGKEIASNNTGPYVKARERMPESAIQKLVTELGASAIQEVTEAWKWRNKEVKGIDGTTILMPDTRENQQKFPQHSNQKAGVGFPILRLVAIMSLSTGVVLNYALGPYEGKGTGECSLARTIFGCINATDVIVGDAYFPSYFFMCDLLKVGADGVFRGQTQRKYDFRTGEVLGTKDHIVEWCKPFKPSWMDEKQYQMYPNRIKIREFKVNGKVYVTTFLNAKEYQKKELSALYELRWECEINLRSIKTIMRMEMLSCKTPDMVRKEIGIHFLAYNVIRILMAEACRKHSEIPNKISFKGTIQLINQFMPYFLKGNTLNSQMNRELLRLIVSNKIGNRPGRSEPRAVKRRRKPFPLLQKAREIEKRKLYRKRERIRLKNAA